MSEDQIRLKNLIHKSVDELKARDDSRELENQLCDRLEELLADRDFWENQTESLLICASPSLFEMFHLPIDSEEYAAVDEYFHLAPIFGLLGGAPEYYVLAVAQQQPMLLKGDMYDLYETGLALPESLEAGLNIDEVNQKRQQQRAAKGTNIRTHGFTSQGGTYGFNGRGGARDPREEDRDKFLRLIDSEVYGYANRAWPLVLAGTEAEASEFRSISKYPNIVPGYINGSFGGARPHDLFAEAWDIIKQEVIRPQHESAIETFNMVEGESPERATVNSTVVAEAAEQGRIDTLLLGMRAFTTDTVRDDIQPVSRLTFPDSGTNKILQCAAQQVWQSGGKVINLEKSQMPHGTLQAASLRY